MNSNKITIIYDNHTPENTALKSSWGFACVIEGFEKTILFDTGTSGPILMHNFKVLGFDLDQIDVVVISHGDWDHLGGLWTFLDANSDLEVYLPASLSRHLKDEVVAVGATCISVAENFVSICSGVVLSGEMQGPRNEQSILLQGADESIILTGCAHPGIVEITRRFAKEEKHYFIMGGFHLKDSATQEIESIVEELKKLGVTRAAPTHCSGARSEKIFASIFGTNSRSLCPGSVVHF